MKFASQFDRGGLPPTSAFVRQHFDRCSRPSRDRVMVRCNLPGHADKTPSMSWNLATGKFYCFGCGRYGDQIDYLRMLYGWDFKRAAQSLGAWREGITHADRRELKRAEAARKRRREEEAARRESERRELIKVRDEIHADTRLLNQIEKLLQTDRNNDALWACMELAWRSRELSEDEYMRLAGLEAVNG